MHWLLPAESHQQISFEFRRSLIAPFPLIYYYIHMCPEDNTAIHREEITLLAVRHVTVFFSLDHCFVES